MPKQVSETYVEDRGNKHAEKLGWLRYKFLSASSRGVPDQVYMKEGLVFFIEYKAPGKTASRFQKHIHKLIRGAGLPVYVCDNVPDAVAVIDEMNENARQKRLARLSKQSN